MTAEHRPYWQNAGVGRFVVCSCTWRSGTGDATEVKRQWGANTGLVKGAAEGVRLLASHQTEGKA